MEHTKTLRGYKAEFERLQRSFIKLVKEFTSMTMICLGATVFCFILFLLGILISNVIWAIMGASFMAPFLILAMDCSIHADECRNEVDKCRREADECARSAMKYEQASSET